MAIYCCPSLEQCSWEGRQHEIIDHIKHQHEEILLEANEFALAVNNEYAINYVMRSSDIADEPRSAYLVQVVVREGKAQVRVRFSGSVQSAAGKRYSIQVQADDMVLTNKISETNRFFYPPIKNQDGMIEIDVNFLKNTWKIQEFLLCRIHFEGQMNVAPEPVFIAPKLVAMASVEEEVEPEVIPVKTVNETATFNRKSLSRTSRSNKSKKLKKQSHFYLSEFLQESQEADELMELLDERITLLKDYSCKKCNNYITGPIYRCASEHSVCHNCLADDDKCACTADVNAEQRNAMLENTRDRTTLPCRFDGCNVSVIGAKLQEHQVQCNHCVYTCPVCKNLIGKYVDVEKHFRIVHPSVKRVMTLENPFPNDSSFVVLHNLGVFYCINYCAANSREWSVEHCGHIKIYFESEVFINSNKQNLNRNYKLEKSEKSEEKNVLRRCVSMREVKASKIRNVVLKITLYQSSV